MRNLWEFLRGRMVPRVELDDAEIEIARLGHAVAHWRGEARKLEERLTRIADCETPSANATVKRMVCIARGEDA